MRLLFTDACHGPGQAGTPLIWPGSIAPASRSIRLQKAAEPGG